MLPQTQYAKSGKVSIAYQVPGDGPIDVIFAPGWVSNVEYAWESPDYARFITHMASFSRFIRFDKRGTGLSDRDGPPPTLEQRTDDIRAVLDAVGSKRATLLGMSEGGNMSIMFAATHPERTTALVLFGSFARAKWALDYPWGATQEQRDAFNDLVQKAWGGPVELDELAPSVAHDEAARS